MDLSEIKKFKFEKICENVVVSGLTVVNNSFYGGVINIDNTFVDESLCFPVGKRFNHMKFDKNINPNKFPPIEKKIGNYIYLGFYTDHWGHYLFDSLSRFIYFCSNKLTEQKIIFQGNHINSGLFEDTMKCFNIPMENIIFLKEKDQFICEKLVIPKSNSIVRYFVDETQNIIYEKIKKYFISQIKIHTFPSKKYNGIFISRNDNRITNEKNIIDIFIDYNFLIINPSYKTLYNDIYLYTKFNVMAGIEGTGLHNCIFMEHSSDLIIINSHREPDIDNETFADCFSYNQKLLSYNNKIKNHYIKFVGNKRDIDINYLKEKINIIIKKISTQS